MTKPFRFALDDNYGPQAPSNPEVRKATQAIFDALMKYGVDEAIIGDAFVSLYGEIYGEALASGEAATEVAPLDAGTYTLSQRPRKHTPAAVARGREWARRTCLYLSKLEAQQDEKIVNEVFARK